MDAVLSLLVGYSLGSMPLGYLIARQVKGVDLRRVGSGNVGATNAYRTGGLALALAVIAIDVAKGAGSVLLAMRVTTHTLAPVTAGLGAVIGHIYPIWLGFRGGKGVATACGVFSALAPVATTAAALVFVAIVWITRYVSLGSVVATAALPPLAWVTDAPSTVVAASLLTALVVILRHRGNLARLQRGTERRLGQQG
jgi:acyl phosphate:glycerol-3-phosphate acyltransferase